MNRFTGVFAGLVVLGLLDATSALSQQTAAQARTRVIVAAFNKSKHAIKERYGVRVEKFKEIRSEPAIKADVRDYSGSYEEQGLGFTLDLRVDANGGVSGSGYDPVDFDASVKRRFDLRNARIEGALLTATKVYQGGVTEPFEGVFINETSFNSPTDKGVTTFGLGVIGKMISVGGLTVDKLFYQRKQ